ncbi:MAG: DNA-binding protein WhiA [Eubacteriales bacterium]|nr:DNA-binding protein WhiA [Eubacteriales bacterium]
MSFSSEVKKELEGKIDSARHCQIAEFAAIMGMSGRVRRSSGGDIQIELITENEIARSKFVALLIKIFNMEQTDIIELSVEGKSSSLIVADPVYVAKILQTLKWTDDTFDTIEPVFVDPRIVQKDCCKKSFIRGAFISAGSISDPNKFYHYEIVCNYEEDAESLKEMLCFFDLDAKVTTRKNSYIVYMKEGNNITDALNLMGAYISQMNLYNVMILKDMRNDVNRKVNCETANLNKTVAAAVKQIKDIEYISSTVGLDALKDNLKQVAIIRLENQDMSLKDIGDLLDPPVGKSGVNHRLRKISEIADEIRLSRGD